jgi:hypothetical protein
MNGNRRSGFVIGPRLERNDLCLYRHFALACCLSMIFSNLPSPAEA